MKTALIAAAVAAGAIAPMSAQAAPDIFVNPEFNQGWVGGNAAGVLDLHVGLEDGPFYIQAGPALATGGGESDWGLTGKTGVSGKVSEKMDLYGEVSVAKFDGVDTAYGLKVGTKYKF